MVNYARILKFVHDMDMNVEIRMGGCTIPNKTANYPYWRLSFQAAFRLRSFEREFRIDTTWLSDRLVTVAAAEPYAKLLL